MKRKNRNKTKHNSYAGRDLKIQNPIANRRLPLRRVTTTPNYLQQLEDRRRFNPSLSPIPRAKKIIVNRQYKNVSKSTVIPQSQTKGSLAFQNPEGVITCVRRKIRKEVLHAFKKTGKVGQRRPKYNERSKIKC